jgi:hypothetical protein
MKVFAAAAIMAAAGIAIGLLLRTTVLQERPDSGIRASPRDPAVAEMRKLIRAGRGRRPNERGIRVLTQHVDGKMWRLAYSSNESVICWALILPHGHADGTCGARNKIRSNPLVGYSGALTTGGPRSHTVFVVYGGVWTRVKALRVQLSDCSMLRVDLSSRPIFWRFLPMEKVRKTVRPTQLVATLFSGKKEEIALGRGTHCQKRRS